MTECHRCTMRLPTDEPSRLAHLMGPTHLMSLLRARADLRRLAEQEKSRERHDAARAAKGLPPGHHRVGL